VPFGADAGAYGEVSPFTAAAAALGRSARGAGAFGAPGAVAHGGADTAADPDAAPTPMTAAIKAIGAATARGRRGGAWRAGAGGVAAAGFAGDDADAGAGAGCDDTGAGAGRRDTPSKGMAGLFARGDEDGLAAAVAALEGWRAGGGRD
jgi:hypothetical protein